MNSPSADTPGHAAFTHMRARGAACTDVAVLVVAADDGIMPQTREALAHARAAGCPIVVALTKCDKPAARPAEVRRQLVSEGVELEEAGGSVQCVEVSAVSGAGLEALSEALLLEADQLDLRVHRRAVDEIAESTLLFTQFRRFPPVPVPQTGVSAHTSSVAPTLTESNARARGVVAPRIFARRRTGDAEGVVLEAKVDRGQGALVTVLLRKGTLSVGALQQAIHASQKTILPLFSVVTRTVASLEPTVSASEKRAPTSQIPSTAATPRQGPRSLPGKSTAVSAPSATRGASPSSPWVRRNPRRFRG